MQRTVLYCPLTLPSPPLAGERAIRPRFIGLFKGPRQIMVVVRVNRDGTLLWNFMQSRDKDMNPHRIGTLIWPKK